MYKNLVDTVGWLFPVKRWLRMALSTRMFDRVISILPLIVCFVAAVLVFPNLTGRAVARCTYHFLMGGCSGGCTRP